MLNFKLERICFWIKHGRKEFGIVKGLLGYVEKRWTVRKSRGYGNLGAYKGEK